MLQTNFLSLNSNIGKKVQIGGFVNSIRDHGGLIFIDLRSQSDLVQCVINPENDKEIFDLAQTISSEFVLKLEGQIVQRDSKLVNPKIPTGSIELIVEKLEIVAAAKPLPFEIDSQNVANEDLRLKYRYLDLRRTKLKEMLTAKSKLFLAVRNWFDSQDFVEVQTPILANSSPEGARDFLIPSRLHPGKFYALPQAPQQFKQLLMVGGFNKYFQIAPCFRDEDPRADRHPGDFYQIDCEIAWADQNDIYDFSWKFVQEVLANPNLKIGNQTMGFTTKKLDPEFTKIRYDEAMDWFGSDKPDLRIRQNSEKLEKGKVLPARKVAMQLPEGVLESVNIQHTSSLSGGADSLNLKAQVEELEAKIISECKAILVDCLIFNEQNQVFVQKRSAQRRLYPNSWDLPGGHVEPGDNVWETISKEIKEETNWDVDQVISLFDSVDWMVPVDSQKVGDNPDKVVLQFVVKVKSTDNLVLEEGKVTESRWVSLDDDLEFLKENKTEDFYIYHTVKKALEGQNKEKLIINSEKSERQEIVKPNIKQGWDVETLTIETERLILKPISMDYAEDIFRELTPEVALYMNSKSPEKIEEIQEFLNPAILKDKQKTDLYLVVCGNENQDFLGVISLHELDSDTPEIGIWLKKSAHGNRYGQEATNGLKTWASVNLNYKYLIFSVDQRNISSRKLAESLGGTLQNKPIENKINKSGYQLEIVKYHIPNSNPDRQLQNAIQDQNWIINNLGWIDAKPIFRNSAFKTFADLCEPIIKQDWDAETLQIETERLILKPANMGYTEDIFKEFTPEITKFMCPSSSDKIEETREFLERAMREGLAKTDLHLAIFNKENQEFLGMIGLHDLKTNTPEIGIWFKKSAHGNKFGQESSMGLKKWADEHLNYKYLIYPVDQRNIGSRKVAESLGGIANPEIKNIINASGNNLEMLEYQIKNPSYQPSNSKVQALVIKNATDKFSRSDLDKIQELGRSFGLPGIAYIQFEKNPKNQQLNAKSPILKFFGDETAQQAKQQEIVEFLGIEANDLVLFVAHNDKNLIHKAQNAIRKHVSSKLDLLDQNSLKFVWVYDFPFFEADDKTGQLDFAHNPFGIFQNWEGLSHLETLATAKEQNRLLELRAVQYDIACNGYEVLSGGRRNNIPECLMEGFKLVGYSEEEVKEKFGHMMEAYSYGAPTHAGFAWGIDRLFMVLVEENNIREIIAFPKNGSGMDLMMNSPSNVRESQLKELSIKSV